MAAKITTDGMWRVSYGEDPAEKSGPNRLCASNSASTKNKQNSKNNDFYGQSFGIHEPDCKNVNDTVCAPESWVIRSIHMDDGCKSIKDTMDGQLSTRHKNWKSAIHLKMIP